MIIPLFQLNPIVSQLSRKRTKKRAMRSKYVKRLSKVRIVFKYQKILLPKRLIITVSDEGPFIERTYKLWIPT